jgi:hypothetical protein
MQELVELAKKLKGMGATFSQSVAMEYVQETFGHTLKTDGDCKALSLKWIKAHTHNKSLLGKLHPGEKKLLQRWKSTEKLQDEGNPYAFLLKKGLKPVIKEDVSEEMAQFLLGFTHDGSWIQYAALFKQPESSSKLCMEILNLPQGLEAAYAYITLAPTSHFDPRQIGHACAAYVTRTDVMYFDANYGEYWLAHDPFFDWWPTYWVLSGYDRAFKSFQVRYFVTGSAK